MDNHYRLTRTTSIKSMVALAFYEVSTLVGDYGMIAEPPTNSAVDPLMVALAVEIDCKIAVESGPRSTALSISLDAAHPIIESLPFT
jgi:hypothetical protein